MNILCFGDSNTFGTSPVDGKRLPAHERWPGILAELLGTGHLVIEAGQPNRTLVNNPPFSGDKSGVKYLKPYLEAQPLDVIIIALGTNDLKARFALSAIDISKALEELILAIKAFYHGNAQPKVIILSPPKVHEVGSYKSIYAGAGIKAEQLSIEFKAVSERQACVFIDGFSLLAACESEGVHWPSEEHKRLAKQLLLFV
ncbi:SGNH/GDSL hydrolase family protein [Pseudoalteromonas sp. APC 3224]|uniref:SGNH/GDSL hydrolase family protein n=1 Tax=Pseudoalteromonas sp. APC 3224 TaxID=3035203 RepID=UPI0025B28A6A|nr:SGNH/GDSL hydrolase family protein [Pseudoalteromonas sp. APC 3224]MDN3485572.1 SGNH/GDSL hydrolase family protein [Pseudoalteromonas sp. APC 3224]